jgi:hypothetical protein
MKSNDRLEHIKNLCLQERDALLQADFTKLEHIITQKEKLLSDPEVFLGSSGTLQEIRDLCCRNIELTKACRETIIDVIYRWEQVMDRTNTRIYGTKGSMEELHVNPSKLYHKA